MSTSKLLGIIILLSSIFPLYYAHMLAGSPSFWIWIGILVLLWFYNLLFQVAWRVFFDKGENVEE